MSDLTRNIVSSSEAPTWHKTLIIWKRYRGGSISYYQSKRKNFAVNRDHGYKKQGPTGQLGIKCPLEYVQV